MVEQGAPPPFDMPDIQARFKELLIQIASGFYHVDSCWVSPMWILALLTFTLNWTILTQGLVGLRLSTSSFNSGGGLEDYLCLFCQKGGEHYMLTSFTQGLLTEGGVLSQEERRLTSYSKSNSFLFVVSYFICILFLSSLYLQSL